MRVFRKVCRRPVGLPAAGWMIGLGTRLLGTEAELILKSRRAVPARLLATGFQFKFPKWREAVQNIVRGEAA
jgi:NAD dependent epimerase/dehydratase family enzyme